MQEITVTRIPGRRQRHETPTRAVTSCHTPVAFDGIVQTIPGSTMLFTADQMDDLHWFFRGFHTKRVADVQKLSDKKNGADQI
jgi:hypothetical protein